MENLIQGKSRVHLFFEQSGTFKKVFRDLGFQAADYDIENQFKQTDFQINLFVEIKKAALDEVSIFNKIRPYDLIFAFFPCTFFTDQSQLISRGDAHGRENWTDNEKLNLSREDMCIRAEYYDLLCKLCQVALIRGFPLIIENPLGKGGFLKQYFPLKPKVILHDRRLFGDAFKKPTQFFFINCEPTFHLAHIDDMAKKKQNPIEGIHGFDRSRITPEFARRFVEQFIL